MGHRSASVERTGLDQEAKLSPVQQKVLASIMAGNTFIDAARDAGVTDRTIRRWRESCPVFESCLRSRIYSARESAGLQASVALQAAVKTLVEIASTSSHPQVMRAIQMILDLNGPLPAVSHSFGVTQVSQEQSLAELQRYAGIQN
jgi:hypothetical protein